MIAGRGLGLEGDLGQVGPQIDLNRQDGGGVGNARRNLDDEGDHADHEKRRRLTEGMRHADDGSRS